MPGAQTVQQAEALLEPRMTEGKRKRRKRYACETSGGGEGSGGAPGGEGSGSAPGGEGTRCRVHEHNFSWRRHYCPVCADNTGICECGEWFCLNCEIGGDGPSRGQVVGSD